nr:hypothetical protein [Campylobacter sp.]
MNKFELLEKALPHLSLVHSTAGRLRVRISPQIEQISNKFNPSQIQNQILQIKGVKEIKFNKIIGSVTINYDYSIIPEDFWLDLLQGKNLSKHLKNIKG